MLGFGKSFVTSATWYYSAAETILIGAISAGAAFGIGSLFGGEEWKSEKLFYLAEINDCLLI